MNWYKEEVWTVHVGSVSYQILHFGDGKYQLHRERRVGRGIGRQILQNYSSAEAAQAAAEADFAIVSSQPEPPPGAYPLPLPHPDPEERWVEPRIPRPT